MKKTAKNPETKAKKAALKRKKAVLGDLGAAYQPAAKTRSMKVETPDSMAAETLIAQGELREYLDANFGPDMSVEEYVRRKLAYPTMEQLENALFAEQIDGVALAIYNIEAKNQGIIVGDQTGIGKGRQAAAIIRYAILRGKKPIFFTEKPNLFSDIYRDLVGIGSEDGSQIKKVRNKTAEKEWDELTEEEQDSYDNVPERYEAFLKEKGVKKVSVFTENKSYDLKKGTHVVPFIVNGRELKSSIKDAEGNILYEAAEKSEQEEVFASRQIPDGYNMVMLTYSQIASGNKTTYEGGVKKVNYGKKAQFVVSIAEGNIIILDEAHNASGGESSTGIIVRDLLAKSEGTVFLSGTFAKRPENMALYAMKTAIGDVNSSAEGLSAAIQVGGVAMQEWVSSILVKEGQMLRRERGMENSGAVVNWITLDETAPLWDLPNLQVQHRNTVDTITGVIRQIIEFQMAHVKAVVKSMNEDMKEEMGEADLNQGTKGAGVDNVPYFSKVFNVINQLLFSTKAEAVALHAIRRLKQDKKVVIAFANTMGAFIDELTEGGIEERSGGTRIKTDFSLVLEKALKGVLKIQISDGWGKKKFRQLQVDELSLMGQQEYRRILDVIRQTSTDILVSPIDVIKHIITSQGYSIAEVTGRDKEVRFDKPMSLGRTSVTNAMKTGVVFKRAKEDASAAFRRFQNNEVDVLLINQSGATGASAHAVATPSVPAHKVKQRVMIIAQAELDVNVEVQKWGRINRTGQILPPVYDYIISAIPAEQRPVMMLQNKLRSLFANTTSSQKSSKDILQSGDFLNKIGDKVVREYVEVERDEMGKQSIYNLCDLSKWMNGDDVSELAKKVAGRVAIIPTARQQQFYEELTETYKKEVERLINAGEYDLEVEVLDLKAKLITEDLLVGGKPEAKSEFGKRSMLGLYEVNNLNKPYTLERVLQLIQERVPEGMTPQSAGQMQKKAAFDYLTRLKDERLQKLQKDFEDDAKSLREKISKAKTPEKAESLSAQLDLLNNDFETNYELREAKEKALIAEVTSVFGAFYAGRQFMYGEERMVCLGIKLNEKAKNPYSLGKIYVEFAVASSTRRVGYNLAKFGLFMLNDILKNAGALYRYTNQPLNKFWEEGVKKLSSDRILTYIITGNLLQAMAQESFQRTRIIDFTKADGTTQKGLLVPYSVMAPPESGEKRTTAKIIPFSQCAPIIENLVMGQTIGTDKMTVFGPDNNYKIMVPASKARGGEIYTDKGLLELVKDNNFSRVGEKMTTHIRSGKLKEFCQYMSTRFGLSCQVNTAQAAMLMPEKTPNMEDFKSVIMGYEPFPKMPKVNAGSPSKGKSTPNLERLQLEMEIEAEAIAIELELLMLLI